MIERDITPHLIRLFKQYPFVTVTGPRQSGKTTLCRVAFPHLTYVNLEAPDQREFAKTDPRGFLSQLDGGAILDEVQRVPDLLSYLQVIADEKDQNSLFVLTGSEHFRLSEAISQSLAGRTALLRLLPFSLPERQQTGASNVVDDVIYSGFYPRIHDQGLEPRQALGDYFETYVERDVRQLGEIRNPSNFRRFVRLCAGRVGQLVNLSSLGADAGVTHTTVREWLTLLEISYIVFQLPPFHANISKRLVKSPKLFFYDVGLASCLIGIEQAKQIATHPLRGALFENMVVVEALKYRFNRGRPFNLSFFRDSRGLECDLLFETGHGMGGLEIKSGATIASDYFDSLNRVAELVPEISTKAVVYGGTTRQSRSVGEVVPFFDLYDVLERFEIDQEMAAFVQEKMGSSPPDSDVSLLDRVYHKHVQPILNELETSLQEGVAKLFYESQPISRVKTVGQLRFINDLREAGNWEQTKRQYIVKKGFKLRSEQELGLGYEYNLLGYTGGGDANGFNLILSISWKFNAEGVSREVAVDNVPISDLADYIQYSELSTHSVKVDRTVARVGRYIMKEIESRSQG